MVRGEADAGEAGQGGLVRLAYLPANQAWTFLLGDSLVRLDGEVLLFTSRRLAVSAATAKGLNVTEDGEVI